MAPRDRPRLAQRLLYGGRPAPFWPVAIIGGIVAIAACTSVGLFAESLLSEDSPTTSSVSMLIVISALIWVAAMTYVWRRRRNQS
jgi:membrane protein DedA with SNARE-associated domain